MYNHPLYSALNTTKTSLLYKYVHFWLTCILTLGLAFHIWAGLRFWQWSPEPGPRSFLKSLGWFGEFSSISQLCQAPHRGCSFQHSQVFQICSLPKMFQNTALTYIGKNAHVCMLKRINIKHICFSSTIWQFWRANSKFELKWATHFTCGKNAMSSRGQQHQKWKINLKFKIEQKKA